ncbi:hypothetical protein [Sphingomonas crusticola]|uniref:hypothetical protein n=1 Tax=Sphingomonas crusticola TaxID=1697973 RepID=UPI000E246BA2|nr:hypothetical protein [Sphingomonas crusticola]
MIGPLLLAAAVVPPVETAERAFASMAQTRGQWTAFRAFAAPDAQMLLDGPRPAAPFLKDRKDPPVAVMWWPAHTITSCDGSMAYSTGPWRRDGGRTTGRFFTIWRHGADGWRWVYDGGTQDNAGTAAGDGSGAVRAAYRPGRAPAVDAGSVAGGGARDGSLQWELRPATPGQYRLTVTYRTHAGWKSESAVVGG